MAEPFSTSRQVALTLKKTGQQSESLSEAADGKNRAAKIRKKLP
jgi:hypothetical protein